MKLAYFIKSMILISAPLYFSQVHADMSANTSMQGNVPRVQSSSQGSMSTNGTGMTTQTRTTTGTISGNRHQHSCKCTKQN